MAAILNLRKIIKTRGLGAELLFKNKVEIQYFIFQVLKVIKLTIN